MERIKLVRVCRPESVPEKEKNRHLLFAVVSPLANDEASTVLPQPGAPYMHRNLSMADDPESVFHLR